MPRIRVDRLEKRYGDTPVIKGLDLDLADKEFTVFVGPSGCGKSTTLRMIAGLETISAGAIWIGDREVSGLEPKDRDIAMVFQDYALYPHMDVAQNMSFSLRLQRLSRADIAPVSGAWQRCSQSRHCWIASRLNSFGRPAPARGDGARPGARCLGVSV